VRLGRERSTPAGKFLAGILEKPRARALRAFMPVVFVDKTGLVQLFLWHVAAESASPGALRDAALAIAPPRCHRGDGVWSPAPSCARQFDPAAVRRSLSSAVETLEGPLSCFD